MNLSSVLHRLGSVERDLRHELSAPAERPSADLSFATVEELDAMEAALVAGDDAELQRLADVVNARAASGERPENVLPLTERVSVGFARGVLTALRAPDEPEPAELEEESEPSADESEEPIIEEPAPAVELETPTEPVARIVQRPPPPPPAPRELQRLTGREWISKRSREQRSHAAGIAERIF